LPPGVITGYAIQTRHIVPILKSLGHEIIVSAFAGLFGSRLDYEGIDVFPSDNWGATQSPIYYKEFEADILISHQDLWTLPETYGLQTNWYPWYPIDSEPPPPKVLARAKYAKKSMVQAKFAQRELKKLDIDSYYVPAGVDTKIFKPGPKLDNFGDRFSRSSSSK